MADYVVEYQTGLTGTNYTDGWYRKWKSGWVEQGGYTLANPVGVVELPVPMASEIYTVSLTLNEKGGGGVSFGGSLNGTNRVITDSGHITIWNAFITDGGSAGAFVWARTIWKVEGMAA